MKLTTLFFVVLLTLQYNLSANWAELVLSNGSNNSGNTGNCVISLSNGDIIIAGQYKCDELQFGEIKLSSIINANKLVSLDRKKAFIAKLSNGKFVWAKTFGSKVEDDNLVLQLKPLSDGGFMLLGTSASSVNIGVMSINKNSKSPFAYLAKFDIEGDCNWLKAIDYYDTPENISFDVNENGDIVVATTVLQTDRKITQDKITYNRPGSYTSAVLIRFNSEGNCTWIRGGVSEGAGSASTAKSVVLDSEGNAYLTGEYMAGRANVSGKLTFNEQSVVFPTKIPHAPQVGAVFVTKYNSEGICQFVSNSGSNVNVINQKPKSFHIALSNDGKNIYVVGRFTKEFNIWKVDGTTTYTEVRNSGQSTIFVAQFNQSGEYQNIYTGEAKNCWVEIAGFKEVENGFYLLGNFAGNLEASKDAKFVSTSNRLIGRQKLFPFVIKLDNSLGYSDCKVLEANGETRISSFATHSNNVIATGYFNEVVDNANFDGTILQMVKGYSKAFIWSFDIK